MATYTNPDISQEPTWKAVIYVDDACAVFTCNGDPEGAILANTGSLALSDNGNVYKKTTDFVNTGWVDLAGGGGGGGADTDLGNLTPTAINEPLIPDADNAHDLGDPAIRWANLYLGGFQEFSGAVVGQFLTPIGNLVPTKISIALFNPGGFGQVLALGLGNTAAATARVISLFDQRAAGHQPTLQIFNPGDEGQLFGLTWDGSDTIAQILTTQILRLTALRLMMVAPASAPTDADIPNGYFGVWINEATNELTFRVRYSGGALRTGVVALA